MLAARRWRKRTARAALAALLACSVSCADRNTCRPDAADAADAAPIDAGPPSWRTAVRIDDNPMGQSARRPVAVVDQLGNVTVAWQQHSGSQATLYTSRYDLRTARWTRPQQLDDPVATSTGISSATLGVDDEGNVIAAWRSAGSPPQLLSRRYRATAGWSSAVTISEASHASSPLVVVTPGGDATAFWRQGNYLPGPYVAHYDRLTERWSTPLALGSSAGGMVAQALCDGAGNIFAVLEREPNPAGRFVVNRHDRRAGRWGEAQVLATLLDWQEPRLSVSRRGDAVVAWAAMRYSMGGPGAWAKRFDRRAGWQQTRVLSTASSSIDVGLDAAGGALAAWATGNLWIARGDAKTDHWGPALPLPDNVKDETRPLVARAPDGATVVLWFRDYALWARHVGARPRGGEAQRITPPSAKAQQDAALLIDAQGRATALWAQTDWDGSVTLWARRYQ